MPIAELRDGAEVTPRDSLFWEVYEGTKRTHRSVLEARVGKFYARCGKSQDRNRVKVRATQLGAKAPSNACRQCWYG